MSMSTSANSGTVPLYSVPTLEAISKTATLIAIFCYVVGLVTVNTYLYALGLSEFSLLRVHFIYVGALVLLSFFLTLVSLIVGVAQVRYRGKTIHPGHKYKARWPLKLFDWMTAAPLIALPTVAFATVYVLSEKIRFSVALAKGVSVHFLILITGCLVWIMWEKIRGDKRFEHLPGWIVILMLLLMSMIGFGIYIAWFAQRAYPLIPEQFGGGRPRKAYLLVTPEAVSGLKQLGLPFTSGEVSESLFIVFYGDDWVLVRLSDGRVLTVDRHLIRGVAPQHK